MNGFSKSGICPITLPSVFGVVGTVNNGLAGEVPSVIVPLSTKSAIASRTRVVIVSLCRELASLSFVLHSPSPNQNKKPHMCLMAHGKQPSQTNTTRQNLSHTARFLTV